VKSDKIVHLAESKLSPNVGLFSLFKEKSDLGLLVMVLACSKLKWGRKAGVLEIRVCLLSVCYQMNLTFQNSWRVI